MEEMITKMIVSSLIAYFSSYIWWWVPILSFPIAFFIIPNFGKGDPMFVTPNNLQARRYVYYLLCIVYTIAMAIVFQIGLGSWFGWLVGTILAWLGCGTIAANLEKYLHFRTH